MDNTRPAAASRVPAPPTADPECSPTPRHRWQPPQLLNDWTGRLFIAGVALIGLHLADDVLIEPVDGRRTLARSLLTVVVLAVLGLLTLGFAATGIRIRAVIAIAIGIYGTITGIGLTTMRVVELGVSGRDWTGIPALVLGGFGLVGLGAVLLIRSIRRRFLRLLALPIGVCIAFYLVIPLTYAVYLTHPPPTPLTGATPADRGFAFEDIRIPTRDGEALAGWYFPSRTGAAIAVLHGSGSNRSSTLDHGLMLARHGFGVLFLDARGHGQSTGQGMDLGWHGPADISAVLDYLTDRPDVRAGVGVLGLSMGAEEAIAAAADDPRIRAVVAEDAGTSTLDDATSTCCTVAEAAMLPALWLTFTTAGLLSDATPRPGLSDAMARIRAPVLLVASPGEARANRIYHAAAPETSELWQLPAGTPHTGGVAAQPDAYERRVSAFFADELLRRLALPDAQR